MLKLATIASVVALATGHGSLIIPPARNNHNNVDPAAIFSKSSELGLAGDAPNLGAALRDARVTPTMRPQDLIDNRHDAN